MRVAFTSLLRRPVPPASSCQPRGGTTYGNSPLPSRAACVQARKRGYRGFEYPRRLPPHLPTSIKRSPVTPPPLPPLSPPPRTPPQSLAPAPPPRRRGTATTPRSHADGRIKTPADPRPSRLRRRAKPVAPPQYGLLRPTLLPTPPHRRPRQPHPLTTSTPAPDLASEKKNKKTRAPRQPHLVASLRCTSTPPPASRLAYVAVSVRNCTGRATGQGKQACRQASIEGRGTRSGRRRPHALPFPPGQSSPPYRAPPAQSPPFFHCPPPPLPPTARSRRPPRQPFCSGTYLEAQAVAVKADASAYIAHQQQHPLQAHGHGRGAAGRQWRHISGEPRFSS